MLRSMTVNPLAQANPAVDVFDEATIAQVLHADE